MPDIEKQEVTKLASVDIGSNAIRLMLCNVYEGDDEPLFKKVELIRFPLRLGEDSFLKGYITDPTVEKLINVMSAFKLMIGAFQAEAYRVCATSAMREASNREEVIRKVFERTGINIEIIEGRLEAEIIYSNHVAETLEESNSYLYIDVGGGSTEVTLFSNGQYHTSRSFNIGTIRLLHHKVDKENWRAFKDDVREMCREFQPLVGIGSGGNINKIFKMTGKKDNRYLSYTKLKDSYNYVKGFTIDQRIKELKLNPDRADVIIPAFRIFLAIMKAGNIDQIMVPQIGLSDGIIHQIYENYKQGELQGQ
jgi:exopolyphosphatase/guanosine-5'-triphosphate,3'-diphosphate pyrophosphatase